MIYSGLINLHQELEAAAKDKTLDPKRRELAVLLLDEIDNSQSAGYMPEPPVDGWLEPEVMPLQTQMEIRLRVTLADRWAQGKPPYKSVFIQPKTQSSHPPTPVESATPDFEDIF